MRRFAIPAVILAASAAMGCQQLFTTSLGEPLAREELSLPSTLSQAQAADLAAQAKANDDAKLAGALVSSLTAQVGGTVTEANAPLAAAAASSAIVASGAAGTVMSALDSFIESGEAPTGADLAELVTSIQAGASASVLAAIGYLDTTGGISDPSIVSGTLSATDYALGAIILAASALPDGVTDPSAMTSEQLATFQDSAEVQSASRIIAAASTIASEGAQDLLDQFAGMLEVPTEGGE